MEFVIYVALLLAGGVAGWFLGRSKLAETKPIVVQEMKAEKPKKRAYVRKVKGTNPAAVTSANATVNVSKSDSLPNGRYVESDKAADAQHSAE